MAESTPTTLAIELPMDHIIEFCQRWQVIEFALFGSVLRDDFRPDSDIDVLVTFAPGVVWSLFKVVDMREELIEIFGRDVDLVRRRGIDQSFNYIRRNNILSTAKVVYVARL